MYGSELKTGRRQTQIGVIKLELGKPLFQEGDLGKELYILEEGRLRITQGKGQHELQLATLEPGAIVGEMALFDGQPRSANVIAEIPSIVKVIPKTAFDKMVSLLPVWLKAIINIVVTRTREANHRLEQSTIPNNTLSLAHFFCLEVETQSTQSFDYFETLDRYSHLSRASQEEFNEALSKLEQNKVIQINDEESGNQSIIVTEPQLVNSIVGAFKDYKNKRPILAKELNDESKKIVAYIEDLQASSSPSNQVKEKFVEGFKSKLPRGSESSMSQLLRFSILYLEENEVKVNISKLEHLKLQIRALPILKALIK